MKKLIALLVSFLLIMTGCGKKTTDVTTTNTKKLKIVTTIFPQYDFVRNIGKDLVDVEMLLKPGAESHSYEPTPQDIKDIQNSDLFIYVGSENDYWVDRIFETLEKKPQTMKLIDLVKTVEEEIVEGMEHEHEHGDHKHQHGDHDHHHHDKFKESDVQERALSEFAGEFQSLKPFVEDGTLNALLEDKAKDNNKSLDEVKAEMLKRLGTDLGNIKIEGDTISLVKDGQVVKSAKYEAKGFKVVKDDDHAHVYYLYQITSLVEGLPTYITLNDHQYKANQEKAEHPHFHLSYSNESFEKALASDESAFYIPANLSKDEVAKMFAPEEHEHEHGDHEHEIDEHVWTSPENMKQIVKAISAKMQELDPEHADAFKKNTEEYLAKISEVEAKFQEVVDHKKRDILVFGDRFPLRYFVDQYHLGYYAAFSGCSTDTEANPATIKFLIDQVKANKIPVVFQIELSNGKIADAICEATGAKKETFYTYHNVTKDQMAKGFSMIDMMNHNVEVLKEALD